MEAIKIGKQSDLQQCSESEIDGASEQQTDVFLDEEHCNEESDETLFVGDLSKFVKEVKLLLLPYLKRREQIIAFKHFYVTFRLI